MSEPFPNANTPCSKTVQRSCVQASVQGCLPIGIGHTCTSSIPAGRAWWCFPQPDPAGYISSRAPAPGYPRPGAVQDHFANLLFIIRCGDVQGSGTNAIPAGPVLLGRSRLSNRNCRVITSVSCLNPGCFQQLAGQVMLNHVFSLLFPIRQ
jgi:hypothetical protein